MFHSHALAYNGISLFGHNFETFFVFDLLLLLIYFKEDHIFKTARAILGILGVAAFFEDPNLILPKSLEREKRLTASVCLLASGQLSRSLAQQ